MVQFSPIVVAALLGMANFGPCFADPVSNFRTHAFPDSEPGKDSGFTRSKNDFLRPVLEKAEEKVAMNLAWQNQDENDAAKKRRKYSRTTHE